MIRFGLLLILAACGVQTVSEENAIEVTLFYNDISLVVFNGGTAPLTELQRVTFTRKVANVGGDDFNADRIPGDELEAGMCFRLSQQGRTPVAPPQCEEIIAEEFLIDPETYFWRVEPVNATTFDVRLDGKSIAQCESVTRGQVAECRFFYPVAP